jgi:hypothetical protein
LTIGTSEFSRWRFSGARFQESEHLKSIRDEAYDYACFEDGEPNPDDSGGIVKFEYVPTPVYYWRLVKEYGMPYSGGWLDQPQLFMKEIDAARRGYEMREDQRSGREKVASLKILADIRDLLTGVRNAKI